MKLINQWEHWHDSLCSCLTLFTIGVFDLSSHGVENLQKLKMISQWNVTGETFTSTSTNLDDDACLDISTRVVGQGSKLHFLMTKRVFDLSAKKCENKSLQQCCVMNKKVKKTLHRTIASSERWKSYPLVFNVNGSMGRKAINLINTLLKTC